MEQNVKEVKMSMDTINKIINYLGRRPYAEVQGLFEEIKKVQPIQDEKVVEGTKSE